VFGKSECRSLSALISTGETNLGFEEMIGFGNGLFAGGRCDILRIPLGRERRADQLFLKFLEVPQSKRVSMHNSLFYHISTILYPRSLIYYRDIIASSLGCFPMRLLFLAAHARAEFRRPRKPVPVKLPAIPRQSWPTKSARWHIHNIHAREKHSFIRRRLIWILFLVAIVTFPFTGTNDESVIAIPLFGGKN
jgi:hypothetical protein